MLLGTEGGEPLSYTKVLPPTVCYFAILFGCAPLFTQVIIKQVCHEKGKDEDDCDGSDVSSAAALIAAVNSTCLYLPTILTTGPFGAIANRYGRKPVLLSSLIGIIVLVATYLYVSVARSDHFFLLTATASFIAGMSGGYSSFIMAIFSYAADTTANNPSLRKQSYPVTEACIFIPKIFCPVLTGIWAASYGFALPLLAGTVLAVIGAAWVLFIPESLPLDSDCRDIPLSLNPLSTIVNISYLFKHDPTSGKSPIPHISVAFSMALCCMVGFATTMLLYAKHKFHWGPDSIGFFDGVEGIITAFSMLCLPAIVKTASDREYSLLAWVQTGYLFRASFYLSMAFVPTTLAAFMMLAVLTPAGLVAPYSRTILSNSVPLRMQAEIFSGFSAVESIATLISPIFTFGYSITTSAGLPEAMFIFMFVILVISFLIVTYVQCSEELYHNLPDACDFKAKSDSSSAVDVKYSVDETTCHYRGSGVISSDTGYSADLQVQKYRFSSADGEGGLRHRLLNEGGGSDCGTFQ